MKLKNLLLIFIGAIILSSCEKGIKPNANLRSDLDTISYVIGADIAISLKNAGVEEINYDAFFNGLTDAFAENDLKIEEEKLRPYINKYLTDLRTQKSEKTLEEGKAFLEENGKKDGIITTESGLQYEIITEGTGKSPTDATNIVNCHYHGTLIDGTEFDSSLDKTKPFETALNRVIPGWTEGIQLMKEGAKYKFYIPTELAYGANPRRGGTVEPNMALIFEVELLEVKEAPEAPKKNN